MNFLHLIIPQNFTEFLIIKIQIILNNKNFYYARICKIYQSFSFNCLIVKSWKVKFEEKFGHKIYKIKWDNFN